MDQTAPQILQIQTKANQSELVTEVVVTDDDSKVATSLDHTYQWQNGIPLETSGDERFLAAPNVTQSKVGIYNSNGTSSNNIIVRERTIKLPETHIFTPVKGSNPISQEVISDDPITTVTLAAGSETLYAKSQIIVKEYHDIEYSLEMPKADMEADNSDFSDFQSVPVGNINEAPVLVAPVAAAAFDLLKPQKVGSSSMDIKWPEPGNVAQPMDDAFDNIIMTTEEHKINSTLPPPPQPSTLAAPAVVTPIVAPIQLNVNSGMLNKKKDNAYLKPMIGTSPTAENGIVEEDDFDDFQAAMPSIPAIPVIPNIVENPIHTKYSHLNDSITLSPRRLVPNVNKPEENHQQSAWISSMDADEIDRIQAAFPKCKTDVTKKTNVPKTNDDEEWSDFVVVPPSSAHQQPMSLPSFASSQPPSTISSNYLQNSNPVSNGESDDWSDFVSVPAKMTANGAKHISISNQFPSRPNFAWNQSKPPASFTHHTSFLSEAPRNQSNYNNSVNITNNFNYNYAMNQQQSNIQPQPKPNISTILPELDFALPKTLLNLPRSHSHSNGSANQLPKK